MNKLQETLVIVLLVTGLVSHAMAGWQNTVTNYHRTSSNSHTGITEQKAITIAQQHFKGRVLALDRSDNTFRIKILSNQGTVHIVLINAINGKILSAH